MKRIICALLALITVIGCAFSLVGCRNDNGGGTTPTPTGPATYTVTLTSEYGLPLTGVLVLIHDEASTNPASSVARAETDREGKASFELEQSKAYSVMLFEPPLGYLPDEKYYFDGEKNAKVELASVPITGGFDGDFEGYSLGDVVHDLVLTDIDGTAYTVSEVLEEKELLILNFWFANCGPCREEFPAFISAYEKNAEKIEIFGINDMGEPVGTIRDYTVTVGGEAVSLPFPTFKADSADNGYSQGELLTAFGGASYPTTVFIDRAGVICYIHYGQLTSLQLTMLIEHFTAEDYKQVLGSEAFG